MISRGLVVELLLEESLDATDDGRDEVLNDPVDSLVHEPRNGNARDHEHDEKDPNELRRNVPLDGLWWLA